MPAPRRSRAATPEVIDPNRAVYIICHEDEGMTSFTSREQMKQYLEDACEGNYGNDASEYQVVKIQSGVITDLKVRSTGLSFSDE